jgi:uncharacterized glyoxalase superfamily protein PhnB
MAQPIPKGHHTITPSLIVKGAAEAIEFYKRAFGAEELGRMPMPGPDGQVKIGHAELQIGDSRLFLADEFPTHGVVGPNGSSPVTLHLYVTDADAVFNRAVAAGATVKMPLANMFWGDRYGKLVDPFGHSWSIGTHIEDVPHEEMPQRMAAAMSKAGGDCS